MDTVRSSSEIECAQREIAETIRARVGDLGSGAGATRSSSEGTVPEMPRLRDGARAVRMTSGLVGEMPPEPPTLRGRVGSWLIRRIRRALFWYTPRIVEFQQNVSRAMEQEVEAIQEIARENEALRLRIAEMETNRVAIESLRKDLTKEITARRAVEAWAGSEVTSLHAALEGQIRAVIDHQETDRNQWHGLLEQEGAAREALEGQIRAVIHQQEADRNQWYGLLEQEAAARESVGSQIAGLRETQHQIRGRLSSLTEDAFRSIDAVASQAAEPRSALEGQIRAVIHQQEADRNQLHGLLEQEAAAREAVASQAAKSRAALEGQIRAVILQQESDRNQRHGLLEQEGAAREALEGQIRAVIHQQEADRNQWHGLLEQEGAARESVASQAAESRATLEGQIRAVIHQQEADRNQWHGLLEQEAAARGAVAADMTVGVNRSDTLERRLSDDERIIFTTRNAVFSQEMRISVLLEQARKRLGKMNAAELAGIVREEERRFDSMYLTFEDHFRGRREDVKDRLRVYLPFLEAHNIGRTGMPILDVGCGRGEWLELLRDHGLDARGVDANRLMVAQCLEQKLPATEGDAVAFLRGLAPDSLGGVSGFHIIEHLPFAYLIDLIDEAVRVLKPGGIVIFETPNPANVLVATEYFYFDPTHRNPLPSLLMRFVAEQRGLCRVEVLELNPWPEAFHLREPGSVVAERFNQLFYGPQEYAIIGWKA